MATTSRSDSSGGSLDPKRNPGGLVNAGKEHSLADLPAFEQLIEAPTVVGAGELVRAAPTVRRAEDEERTGRGQFMDLAHGDEIRPRVCVVLVVCSNPDVLDRGEADDRLEGSPLSHSSILPTTTRRLGWDKGFGRGSIAVTRYPRVARERQSVDSLAPTSKTSAPRGTAASVLKTKGTQRCAR